MSSRGLCHPCSLRDEKKRSGRGVGILGENLSGWSFRIRGLCSKISAPPGPAEKSPRAAVRILQGAAGAAGHARFAQENEGKGMAGPQMAFQSRGESCPSRLHGFSTKAALDLGMCSLLGAHPAASVGLSPLPHTHTQHFPAPSRDVIPGAALLSTCLCRRRQGKAGAGQRNRCRQGQQAESIRKQEKTCPAGIPDSRFT